MFPNGRVQLLSILYFDEKYIQFYIYFCFLVYIFGFCFYRLFGVYLFLSVVWCIFVFIGWTFSSLLVRHYRHQ